MLSRNVVQFILGHKVTLCKEQEERLRQGSREEWRPEAQPKDCGNAKASNGS